jgi:hypothetical protein
VNARSSSSYSPSNESVLTLLQKQATIGFFPWRFVDGESSIGRCVAMVDDAEYEELMARKAELPKTRFGDGYNPANVERINGLTRRV